MTDVDSAELLDGESYHAGVPHRTLASLRARGSVVRLVDASTGGTYVAVLRRAPLDVVSKNPSIFSSARPTAMPWEFDSNLLPVLHRQLINTDPPRHTVERRALSRRMGPKWFSGLEPIVRGEVHSLLSGVRSRGGRCEFVGEFASIVPLASIFAALGVPRSDVESVRGLLDAIGFNLGPRGCGTSESIEASSMLFVYALELGARLRDLPDVDASAWGTLLPGSDPFAPSALADFATTLVFLLVAANESARSVISHAIRLLSEHRASWDFLASDRGMIPGAVEEILRFEPPFTCMRRTATADFEIDGVQVARGEKVVLFYPSVNRDEHVFGEHANRLSVDHQLARPSLARDHRAFGVGEHACLGSSLARLELRVVLEELFEHVGSARITGDVLRTRSCFLNGIDRMDVTFDFRDQRSPTAV